MRLFAFPVLASFLFALALQATAAANLPRPQAEVYSDPDYSAQVRVAQLEDDARFDELRAHAENAALGADAVSALAYAYGLRGAEADARAMLALARELAAGSKGMLRHVLWSSGWTHLHLGDYAAAADAWSEAARLHGGAPFWLPYTMAVLAELQGQRALALEWYDAAARSNPRWSHPDGVAQATHFWQRKETEALDRLFQAWQAGTQQGAPSLALEDKS